MEAGTDFALGGSNIRALVSCQLFICPLNSFYLHFQILAETALLFVEVNIFSLFFFSFIFFRSVYVLC